MLQYFDMSSTFDATVYDIVQPVPAWAPAGTYVVYHNLGFSTETSLAWDQYSFEKTAAADGISQADLTGNWDSVSNSEELHWKVQEEISDEPAESINMFSMDPVTPNPFNPSTTVSVTFPQRAELEITVYDVLGRQVAVLAKGSYEAGPHQFVLDGSSLASGSYFVHVIVPGELSETRKVMLVR